MRVACFGETLWDIVGGDRFLGGAPLNVAYHLRQLGTAVELISAVGEDSLGTEAIAQVERAGIGVEHVRRHPQWSTGTAGVQMNEAGEPTFSIADPAAWDGIADDPVALGDALRLAPPVALVFGTLALRRPVNRRTLDVLLDMNPSMRAVCDLNLRPPHHQLSPVTSLVRRAWLLKMNDSESHQLAPSAGTTGDASADVERRARMIRDHWQTPVVCVTQGSQGAGVLAGDAWIAVSSTPVEVVDAIGAGDAFMAALLASVLAGGEHPDWRQALARACRLGGYVATQRGAQPDYDGHAFLA